MTKMATEHEKRIIALFLALLMIIQATLAVFPVQAANLEDERLDELLHERDIHGPPRLLYKTVGVEEGGRIQVLLRYDPEDGCPPLGCVKILKKYKMLPLVLAEVDADAFERLGDIPGVVDVYPDVWVYALGTFKVGEEYPYLGSYPAFLNETTHLVGADEMWRMGFRGEGVTIAILDTGINKEHPNLDDLDDNPETEDPKVIEDVSFVPGEDAEDRNGHGTLVAGIAAGTGAASSQGFLSGKEWVNDTWIPPETQVGVAPAAKLYNVKVLNKRGEGKISWIVSGVEWAVEHGADVISMSLGGFPLEASDPLTDAIKAAVEAGVVVVVAAGNEGPGGFTVSSPAISPYAITVGATYETGQVAYFSSRGPTPYWILAKPDLVAPGAAVISTPAAYREDDEVYYEEVWGTSAAAPHVAGAAALLRQAFPNCSALAIKAALMMGAKDLGLDCCIQGAGLLDIPSAYKILRGNPAPTTCTPAKIDSMTWPTVSLYPGDFKVLNITVVSGGHFPDAKMRIEGSVKSFMSFSGARSLGVHLKYKSRGTWVYDTTPYLFIYGDEYDNGTVAELGNFTGQKSVAVQLVIPEDAKEGVYHGSIKLVNGTRVAASIPVEIEVRKPKGRVILDDVSHYPDDVERLWGGSFMGYGLELWWRVVAEAGYDVDSLAQTMNKTSLDQWAIFLSGNYQVVYLHDTDLHRARADAFPKLLSMNVSIVALYDGGFSYSWITTELYPEFSEEPLTGVTESFNRTHPISQGVGRVAALGGGELAVYGPAEVVATIASATSHTASGVYIATYEEPGGGRLVSIGDSNFFDIGMTPDFLWYFLLTECDLEVESTDAAQLAVNILDYAMERTPQKQVTPEKPELIEKPELMPWMIISLAGLVASLISLASAVIVMYYLRRREPTRLSPAQPSR